VNLATWGLTVLWRPGLEFYENRFSLVRELLALSDASSWRRGSDDSFLVRLSAGETEVTVGPESFLVSSVVPGEGSLEAIVGVCFRLAPPARVRDVMVQLQHLVPMTQSYDEARRHAAATFVSGLASAVNPVDFALLFDVDTDTWFRQSELGVVSSEEIPVRLSRSIGKLQQYGSPRPPAFWNTADFPKVGLFVDSVWRAKKPPPDADAAWVLRAYRDMRTDCEAQVNVVIGMVGSR
jgi:hypothetical protein